MLAKTRTLYNCILSILENAGIEEAHLETEVLLMWASSTDRTGLYTNDRIDKNSLLRLKQALRQRPKRLPLQYLTGKVEFYGLTFLCRPGVFIPRTETETVVETALELLKDIKNPFVLDLCTGTGAIGLSIAKAHKDSLVTCTDINPEALALASENASNLGLRERTRFYLSDLFETLPKERYHLIVSNPPYIPTEEVGTLQFEINLYEPKTALDGGPDGLRFYKRILSDAGKYLLPDGYVVFEIGAGQEGPVREIAEKKRYEHLYTKKDLLGIPRAMVLKQPV
jgi:release factor glutamine methyltransferase